MTALKKLVAWLRRKDTLTVDIEHGRQPGPGDTWRPKKPA